MLLDVADLKIVAGASTIVRGATFSIEQGETVGLVGESGSGKSLTALAILGLLPNGVEASGSLEFEGRDLLALDEAALTAIRGRAIAIVFQEPMSALNPLQRVGRQVGEGLQAHFGMAGEQALARATNLLGTMGLGQANRAAHAYPHQLSGGQRQRALLAMALVCGPRLLIADEPTTALDATTQSRILDLIDAERRERGMAALLVSHDLAVVAHRCERMIVMLGGEIVEAGRTGVVLSRPAHPYMRALLAARPSFPPRKGERLAAIAGAAPSGRDFGPGCPFAPRCTYALPACSAAPIERRILSDGREVRCLRLDAEGVLQ